MSWLCTHNHMIIIPLKNIERHTTYTIVSWPNPKQWVIVHTSDLMMIIRQSMYILFIITKEMGKLKTRSPTYCIMDNWENMLNLTHSTNYIWYTVQPFQRCTKKRFCTLYYIAPILGVAHPHWAWWHHEGVYLPLCWPLAQAIYQTE